MSYAIGLAANADNASAVLAADRNFPACHITLPSPTLGHIGLLPGVPPPYWGKGLHQRKGDVLFADGHVEKSYDAIYQPECIVPEYLVYPDVKASPAASVDEHLSWIYGNPSPTVVAQQHFSSPASAANPANPQQGRLISSSRASRLMPDVSDGGGNATVNPLRTQAVEPARANRVPLVGQVLTHTAAATATDLPGMPALDSHLGKTSRNVISWVYLVLLLLFLLWLSFKMRREWKRWRQRLPTDTVKP